MVQIQEKKIDGDRSRLMCLHAALKLCLWIGDALRVTHDTTRQDTQDKQKRTDLRDGRGI